jgi:hypothetical protein
MEKVASWHRTFASVLNDKDTDFISFGCRTNQLKNNFESFIDLIHEKSRIGDPLKLI